MPITAAISSDRRAAFELSRALARGDAALHPTDTIPGLTFHPRSAAGADRVRVFKQRQASQPFLGLALDAEAAFAAMAPLPEGWRERLAGLWPGPYSIIWQASDTAPRSLVAPDGTIGLRVPRWPAGVDWMHEVLREAGGILPTTSVNRHGEAAQTTWIGAARCLAAHPDIHVPVIDRAPPSSDKPSTVVKITGVGTHEILRGDPI